MEKSSFLRIAAVLSLTATAAVASEIESPPATSILPIYPPQIDPSFVLSVPRDDRAPMTGDRPTLAPAAGDQPLTYSLFTEPAPPPPQEPVEAMTEVAAVAAAPQVQPPAPARAPNARATRPAPQVAPRREVTAASRRETTRRIEPGWLLGVYR